MMGCERDLLDSHIPQTTEIQRDFSRQEESAAPYLRSPLRNQGKKIRLENELCIRHQWNKV